MCRNWLLAAALFLVGCGGDDGPGSLTVDEVNGSWQLELTQTDNCSELAFDGTYYATLEFSTPSENGGTNTVSHWTNDADVPDRFTLIGDMNVQTGEITLAMWNQVLAAGAELSGTIDSDLRLTGTVVDPRPGYEPVLSLNGCEFEVTGHRE